MRPTDDGKHSVENLPIELVNRFTEGLAPRSAIGIDLYDKPKVMNAVSSALVVDGVRQDYLDGHAIDWIEGRAALLMWMQSKFLGLDRSDISPYRELLSIRDRLLHSGHDPVIAGSKLNEAAQKKNRLVSEKVNESNTAGRYFEYERLSEDEYAFVTSMNILRSRLHSDIDLAIEEGRVIAVEQTQRGARLTPAKRAYKASLNGVQRKTTVYLPTSLIEPNWLRRAIASSAGPRGAQRDKCKSFLLALFKWCEDNNKRISRKLAVQLTHDAADVPKATANEVWETAAPSRFRKGGRIPDEENISPKEINEIKQEKLFPWKSGGY